MRHHTVTFHLAETESTVTGTTFGWLARQDLCRTAASRMDLIADHMLQALVIGRIEEYHDLHSLSSEPVVHDLVAVSLVAQVVQLVRNVLYGLPLERRGVSFVTVQTGNLAENSFDQVTNGHTRRDGVWVDNHVWHDALHSERKILLSVGHATGSFLPMSTGELVSDLGCLDRTHLDLD